MKAVILRQTGGVENLETAVVETPEIQDNEVLIEVKAISVNPVDYKVRGNDEVLTMIYGPERPAILGWDVAGVISKVGKEVSKFGVGDRIFGMVNFLGAGNAYAELVAAPENHIAKIPDGTTYAQAAASTLAALTALQVLEGSIQKGDRVLIHAGSGGVGHFAIQIAKSMGAYVISTSSARNKEFIKGLGADEHIDYRTEAFQEVLSDIDFVFDMFNGEVLLNSVKVVKPQGKVVSIPTPEFSDETQKLAKEKEVDLSFLMVQSSANDMDKIANLLKTEKLKPHISKTFGFDEIALAHQHLESGRTVGKVVVEL